MPDLDVTEASLCCSPETVQETEARCPCRCFEGALAACAAPLVGKLAEKMFGFTGSATRSGEPALDLERAKALGSSLLVFLIVPWTLCLIAYSFLHWTYPRDKSRAALEARALAEASAEGVNGGGFTLISSMSVPGARDSEETELLPKDRRSHLL